ncbi:MAG: MBL fold metallo-hydrolase [Eubacterium sp.]|nr:MBL fold metallo-hydrolase [Eubacterium sp.]
MIIAPIASGSSGNCILVEEKGTNILVDAGISKKRIENGLSAYGIAPQDLDGILITHEHLDHVQGLGVFLRKYDVPVYATRKTIEAIFQNGKLGALDESLFYSVKKESRFALKNLMVSPIAVNHDAADPVCYRFDTEEKSCAVVTDLGVYDSGFVSKLQNLDSVLLEANYDTRMLEMGPYPYHLKQRIWGDRGHLSNESCGRLLSDIISERLKNVILGHLSKENNYPDLAFCAVRNEINFADNEYSAEMLNIKVAKRMEPSCLVEF